MRLRPLGSDLTSRMHSAFENAFAHAPIGMALVDMGGRVLRVNNALCRITGYSADEVCVGCGAAASTTRKALVSACPSPPSRPFATMTAFVLPRAAAVQSDTCDERS